MSASAADVLAVVQGTLQPDNEKRNAAERAFEEAKTNHPAALVEGLFAAIQEPQVDLTVRQQSAILLRKCLENADGQTSLWARLGEAAQGVVRKGLLQILEGEPQPKVRRMVADTTQALGNQLVALLSDQRPTNAAAWPELLPMLMRVVSDGSKDAGVRADCVWTMRQLAVSVWQILVANSNNTCQVLQGCLADAAVAVRAQAAALLCALVDNIEVRAERKPFAPLIPEAMGAIVVLAQQPDNTLLKDVLECMQSSTEAADFLKEHLLSHVLPIMKQIALGHSDEDCRKSALEVCVTYLETKPKVIFSKMWSYVEQLLEVCIVFTMTLDDDISAWVAAGEEDADEEDGLNVVGKEALDRVCRVASSANSFKPVAEVLKKAVATQFSSGDWKQIIGGMASMNMMVEFIEDEATIEQMASGLKMQLGATNPRVRYVAWGGIAQFAEDHPDTITKDGLVAQLLPEFLKGMEDPCARVALRSMQAFQFYGENLEREDLEPFLQQFMEKLGVKLQAGPAFQKKAITYVAVIARAVEDSFKPYYPTLMPFLTQIVQSALHKPEERTLLGKCFECISLLAETVGRQAFKADAQQIMEFMIKAIQVPDLPSNDPVLEYMMAACERIAGTLKEEFVPLLPHVLPYVLAKCTMQPHEFNTALDNFTEDQEVSLQIVEENGQKKVMIMNNSELEDLTAALECLNAFVTELGKAYAPFVAQTATALLPCFDFNMGEDIRNLAFETWGGLCKSGREDGKTQVVGELIMEFLNRMLPSMEGEQAQADLFALKTRIDGITTCLKKAGPGILQLAQVQHLCEVTLRLAGESLQRRADSAKEQQARTAAQKAGTIPDEDDEEEEDGEEQALRVALFEVAGALMEHHPDHFATQALGNFLLIVQQLVQADASSDDRKLALYIICDFLEHLGERVTAHWDKFMPVLLEAVLNEDVEMRQAACYGVRVAAKSPAFAPLAAGAADCLARIVTEARGRSKKKKADKLAQAAADNALSGIINILLNHSLSGYPVAKLWDVWVGGLPCKFDEQEAQLNHKILLKLIVEERAEVVGEGCANVPRLLEVLLDVYQSEYADEETSQGISQLLLRLGEAKLLAMASSWSEKHRMRIMRAVRQAQAPR